MMWGWGAGWWLVGAVFMVICMLMMAPMMSRMSGMGRMGRGRWGDGQHGATDDPERTLAGRLASGEIDTEEYERRLEALRHTDHPTPA